MRMTVSDIVDLIDWGRILNVCPRKSDGSIDPRVYLALNRSQYRMMSRGDFMGSIQVMKLCITSGCITTPRQIERIDAAKLSGQVLSVRNPWYDYIPPISNTCGNGVWFGHSGFNWTGADLLDAGYHTTFRDVNPPGKKLRIYPDSPLDVGKEVYIQAFDDNSQAIIESAAYAGFKMTVALPFVESAYFVSSIISVIKPQTERNLNLYQADSTANLVLLAIYEPTETTIELRRYQVPGCWTANTECPQSFMAVVKLKHIPVARETDLLVIENPAAFEDMIKSLEYKDANQQDAAMKSELNAVRELSLEKRNRSPSDEIPIVIRTCGNASPWKHGVGQLW